MAKEKDYTDLLENLRFELHRGSLVLAVLSLLQNEAYGYALKQQLAQGNLEINEGTLYPLLRRLESQALLDSEWRVIDEARPRRYYKINELGSRVLADLSLEWKSISQAVNGLLD